MYNIYMYIYIKAQWLVKAIDANHPVLPPHRSCARKHPESTMPRVANSQADSSQTGQLPTHLTQPLTPVLSST